MAYYRTTIESPELGGQWQLAADVYEGDYDIERNTSPVILNIYVRRTRSSWANNGGSYYGDIKLGSTRVAGYDGTLSYPTAIGTSYMYLTSTSFTLEHNPDGSASPTITITYGGDFNPFKYGGSFSGSVTLSTIPRASEISSMSNVYIGEGTTIYVNRKSSSFTHTITYSFGSLSDTIVTKSSSTGVSWTIPETFYGQMTDTTQKNVTLYITTYSGNSQVGDRKSTTFTLRTKESVCKPNISASIKDINRETRELTGNELYIVKNHSTVQVTYEATPKNSARISQVDVNKRIMSASPYTFTASESEKNEIVITAKDSRGYTSSKQLDGGTVLKQSLLRWTPDPIDGETIGDYVFVDYISPTAKITVTRKAPTSDELLISFSGNYFNDTFGDIANVLTLSWKYREYKSNPTDWNDITAQTLVLGTDYVLKGNSYHSGDNADYEEEISLGHLFDYRKNYEIQFIYSDKLEKDRNVTSLGIKGIPIVNWSDDFFNVNGDIRQYNKSILQPSACKMETYDYTSIGEDQTKTVDVWQEGYELGDYECDTLNNRLIIKNTSLCHIAGAIAGNGYLWARIKVFEDGVLEQINEWGVLIQTYGNGYFCTPLQSPDVQLNPEKTYYVMLDISGYHQSFNLNAGFGPRATWISARKIY